MFGNTYYVSTFFLEQGINVIHIIVLYSFFVQWPGIIGSNGISPAIKLIKKIKSRKIPFMKAPSLFRFNASDFCIKYSTIFGILLSFLALSQIIPSFIAIFYCWILYISILTISQPYLGLQMHATVVETDFIYFLALPLRFLFSYHTYSVTLISLCAYLLFRVTFGSGVVKYTTREKSWRDGTAMTFHYYSQPLPNTFSKFFHSLPFWFSKLSVYMTHMVEDIFVFGIFIPNRILNDFCFINFFGLMAFINISGNYGFLGILTILQTFCLVEDSRWNLIYNFNDFTNEVTKEHFEYVESSNFIYAISIICSISIYSFYFLVGLVPLISCFYGTISFPFYSEFKNWMRSTKTLKNLQIRNKHFQYYSLMAVQKFLYVCLVYPIEIASIFIFNSPLLNNVWAISLYPSLLALFRKFQPFRLVNRYAKFGSMTKYRWELVVEASWDGKQWKEYQFKYKPGDPTKSPKIVVPLFHLPGLDWRLWFLPHEFRRGERRLPGWYRRFLGSLLEGRPEVLHLLQKEWPGLSHEEREEAKKMRSPPKYVRTLVYDYKFSTTPGQVWDRDLVAEWGGVFCRDKPQPGNIDAKN